MHGTGRRQERSRDAVPWRGGIRDPAPGSSPYELYYRGGSETYQNGWFFTCRVSASLARKGEGASRVEAHAPALLSCPAQGRPHLRGEAARPYLVTTETKPKDRSPKAPAPCWPRKRQ